jgi:hypothetical protein
MVASGVWWTWLPLSILFSAPWIAAIVWICVRTPGNPQAAPSVAEVVRRRLWDP